jgi:hypothetical protein
MAAPVSKNEDQRMVRRAKALELRLSGKSYRKVGEALGVTPETAYILVKAELDHQRETTAEMAHELVEIEEQRLTEAYERIHAQLSLPVDHSNAPNSEAVIRLTRELRNISESRRRLHGIDAPNRVVQDTTVKFEIVGISPEQQP